MSEGSATGTGFTEPVDEGRVVGGESWDEVGGEPAVRETTGSGEARGGALWREVRGGGVFGRRAGRPPENGPEENPRTTAAAGTTPGDAFPPPAASARFPDTSPPTSRPGTPLRPEPGPRVPAATDDDPTEYDADDAEPSRYDADDTAVSEFEVSGVRPYISRAAQPPASDTPRPPAPGSAWTPFSRSRMAPPARPADAPRPTPADTPAWTPTSSTRPPEFDFPTTPPPRPTARDEQPPTGPAHRNGTSPAAGRQQPSDLPPRPASAPNTPSSQQVPPSRPAPDAQTPGTSSYSGSARDGARPATAAPGTDTRTAAASAADNPRSVSPRTGDSPPPKRQAPPTRPADASASGAPTAPVRPSGTPAPESRPSPTRPGTPPAPESPTRPGTPPASDNPARPGTSAAPKNRPSSPRPAAPPASESRPSAPRPATPPASEERPSPARPDTAPAPESHPSPPRPSAAPPSEGRTEPQPAQDPAPGTIPPRPTTSPKSARPGTSRGEPVMPSDSGAGRTDAYGAVEPSADSDPARGGLGPTTPARSPHTPTDPARGGLGPTTPTHSTPTLSPHTPPPVAPVSYGSPQSSVPRPDPSLSWTATPVRPAGASSVEVDEGPREPWVRGRVVAATACVVLGLGLIGGAATGSWLVGDNSKAAGGSYAAASAIWHSVPVDQLFPATVDGQGAGPGGADRTWTRIGVAPDAGCENAFDPLLAQVLAPVGCDRLLRATYIDATQSYVTTVGLLFTKADAATMRELDARFEKEGLARRTDLMPRPYAAPDTLAARFGTAERASWTVSVLTDAPVVVYSVSGWADNRTVDTPQSATEATATGATTAIAQSGLGNEAKGLADRIERSLRKAAAAPTEQPS
ncbi:hypothetical protein ABZX85_23575 [Streptomyces sp. NPDC004539]|uniref:hypothetical protein n=1 Tax=Streptomyces sp. NPDC004539 TaxID=3154280 RepID=UPI0033B7BAD4